MRSWNQWPTSYAIFGPQPDTEGIVRYWLYKIVARVYPPAAFFCEWIVYVLQIRLTHPSGALVSYPKSGRTWLHHMLVSYYGGRFNVPEKRRIIEMSQRDRRIPSIVLTHDGKADYFWNRRKSHYRQTRVLFVVRDPRDTVVSHYHQYKDRDGIYHGSLSAFIRDRHYGIETLIAFLNCWARAVNSMPDFLLVRYEDLRAEAAPVFRRVLEFLGEAGIDEKLLQEAVDKSSFDAMKAREAAGQSRLSGMQRVIRSEDSHKVRKGKVGGYRLELVPADIAYVDRMVEERLDPFFGYSNSAPRPTRSSTHPASPSPSV